LNLYFPKDTITQQNNTGGLSMKGQIYCNKCSKRVINDRCICGHATVYLRYIHEGQYFYRRRYPNGNPLDYEGALYILAQLSIDKNKDKNKEFNPNKYTDTRAKELILETQMELWYQELETRCSAGELKPAYFHRLESYRRTHFVNLYELNIEDIQASTIARFKNSLNHLKIKTRKNILSALHVFLEWFSEHNQEMQWIDNYRIPDFPKIKGNDARVTKAITIEAQDKHLAEITEKHRDIIEFAMEIGCRRGELCAYKVKDVDLANSTILTERAWSDHTIAKPKNGKVSTKLLSPRAIEICKKNIQGKLPEAWLFVNPDSGNYYQTKKIDELWATTSSTVKFHEATRHSYGTNWGKILPVQMVQILLGHSDIRSTMVYYHGGIETVKEAISNVYYPHTGFKGGVSEKP
jgi:integrase